MKKFIKYFFIIILISIISFGFIFRNKISLYIAIGKKYLDVKNQIEASNGNSTLFDISPMNEDEFKSVEYKNTNNTPLYLDVYGPKKELKKGSPVILYVHGGSWAYGDKNIPAFLSPLLDAFREEGYTIVSVSYELMRNSINFDKQASDVKDSIRWIYKNKDEYNFNTDEIGVIGISAGAHLSMLASYSNNDEFIGDPYLANYNSKVKYILDFFGPTDLSTLDITNVNYDLGVALSNTKNHNYVIEKFSPINYIKEDLPKTLIVHSKSDNLVPFENSQKLYNELEKTTNKVDLITINDAGHDLTNLSFEDAKNVSLNILKFIINNSPN